MPDAQVGNTYTASVWMGLAGLVEARGAGLEGRRVLVFSYGAGSMATLLAFVGRRPDTGRSGNGNEAGASGHGGGCGTACGGDAAAAGLSPAFSLSRMAEGMELRSTIAAQIVCTPSEYDMAAESLTQGYRCAEALPPAAGPGHIWPGAYFIESVDERGQRQYSRQS
eukprot:365302-Chlamydomonas_euryale.AAC.4